MLHLQWNSVLIGQRENFEVPLRLFSKINYTACLRQCEYKIHDFNNIKSVNKVNERSSKGELRQHVNLITQHSYSPTVLERVGPEQECEADAGKKLKRLVVFM